MVKGKARQDEQATETRIVVPMSGHNNPEKPVDGKKLMGFIEKLEKVQRRVDAELQEKREVYADAKAIGYDNKTIRAIIKRRAMDEDKRKEADDLMTAYQAAIGMLDD